MLKCECIAFGNCEHESKWLVSFWDHEDQNRVWKVCRTCYARLLDMYEGRVTIYAMSKIAP